jgi:hypothetical protein
VTSWVFGIGLPGRLGGLAIGLAAAAGADVAVTKWHEHGYEPILGILGVAITVMFIHQLTRGVVRSRVVESLADITILIVAVTAIAGLLLLRYQGNGDITTLAVIAAAGTGLVAAHLTDALVPAPRFDPAVDKGLPAVVVGVLVGAALGLLILRRLIDFTGGRGAFAGSAVAAVACLISIGASFAGADSTLFKRIPGGSTVTPRDELPAVVADHLDALDAGPASKLDATDERHHRQSMMALRPVAAVLMTLALTVPAGYVLINALAN